MIWRKTIIFLAQRCAIICHAVFSYVARRSAIEAIGGIPPETCGEDSATSIELNAAGYKTLYLDDVLSPGQAAHVIGEWVGQRLRFARGALQALYVPESNPFTVPGLSFVQRVVHGSGIFHFLVHVPRAVLLLMPLVYLWFGVRPMDTVLEALALFYLPYLVMSYLTLSWLSLGYRSAFWSDVYETLVLAQFKSSQPSHVSREWLRFDAATHILMHHTTAVVRRILTRTGGFLATVSSHSLQPYRGCAFGSSQCGAGCYVRHNRWLTRGEEWGSFVETRTNAAAAYRAEVERERNWARRRFGRFGIFLSSSTEPFQPVERRAGITRAVLEAMLDAPPDFLILQTHSHHVADYLDLYPALAARTDLRFHISIESDIERLPGLPPPASSVERRIAAAAALKAAGLCVVITVSPLFPMLNPDAFFQRLTEVADAGIRPTHSLLTSVDAFGQVEHHRIGGRAEPGISERAG